MKARKERQTAPYVVVNGMFLSLPEKGKVGAEKEKEREERELFYKSHLQNPGPGRRAAVVNKRAASCRRVEAQWAFA